MLLERLKGLATGRRIEVAWAAFVGLNLVGVLVFEEWATVPFHFIWISMAVLYGFRVWGVRVTLAVLALVACLTAVVLGFDVAQGYQAMDEMTEVPLMSAVFLAMLWHVHRGEAANRELRRVSETNLRLLEKQRRFVQDASHVFRTPLTIARGHAELLVKTSTDPASVHDAEVILDEVKRLQGISDRLLELALADEERDEPARVTRSLPDLLRAFCRKWSATGAPVTLGRVDDVELDLDVPSMTLALDELVDNALKHGGRNPVHLSAVRQNGSVVLRVVDEGPGVPPHRLERIFERFARAEDSVRGDGLGLSLVRRVVEEHGGSITARSEAGRGGVFEMRLPQSPAGSSGP